MTLTSPSAATELLEKLKRDYPQFSFVSGRRDHWSPRTKTVIFKLDQDIESLRFGLLHELAHALLGHSNYESDLELIKLESDAWQLAAKIGSKYGIIISDDHIQNCLDTYRDWLHRRSLCPTCYSHGLQQDANTYRCLNCQSSWSVTSERFVRAYRRSQK